jgi:hypothetical protein
VNAAVLPRGTRWAVGRPYAPLLVCLGFAAVQLVAWPLLFLLGIRYRFSFYGLVLVNVAVTLWFLLPLGAVYGLYIGRARYGAPGGGGGGGGVARVAGIVANAVYLTIGILLWIGTLSGAI